MEELIKNESLIDDCQVNGLATTYTLMNLNEKNKKTKLGEVLNYLLKINKPFLIVRMRNQFILGFIRILK